MPKKPVATEQEQEMRQRIGASIRMRGAVAGMRATDIAQAAGVSLAHQYRIESGERTPDVLYLIKVAQHLGISIDALCGIDDAATAAPVAQTANGMGIIQVGGAGSSNRVGGIRNKRIKNLGL